MLYLSKATSSLLNPLLESHDLATWNVISAVETSLSVRFVAAISKYWNTACCGAVCSVEASFLTSMLMPNISFIGTKATLRTFVSSGLSTLTPTARSFFTEGIFIVVVPVIVLTVVPAGFAAALNVPPLPLPDPAAAVPPELVVVVVPIVTLVVALSVPPAVPETDNENAHVPEDDGAVIAQLCDDEVDPAIVPTVLVAPDIVQLPDVEERVAVTAAVSPAVAVPAFCIVAEMLKAEDKATVVDDGLSDIIFRSAADSIVICVQSTVHVPPISMQTSWDPAVLGVSVKSRLLASPELMLAMT